nr:probable protein arginine N-methyltransferase 1 [Tanacetum cinerariifolium]
MYPPRGFKKHVNKVKCSQIADMAKEIVKANGFSDVITVFKGKVEELELPVPKEMQKDCVGSFTYKDVILNNTFLFKDKIVLDIGAGYYVSTNEVSLICQLGKGAGAHGGVWERKMAVDPAFDVDFKSCVRYCPDLTDF